MAPLALPRVGSRVTLPSGTGATVTAIRPGNCVEVETDLELPGFMGQPTGTRKHTELVNVGLLTNIIEKPLPPNTLELGDLRLVDQHGEDITRIVSGVQYRAFVAALNCHTLPTLNVYSPPGGAVEVLSARPGHADTHGHGTTLLERHGAGKWGRSWLLRGMHGGVGGVSIEAAAPGTGIARQVGIAVDGIDRIVIRPSGPLVAGTEVGFNVDPLTATNATVFGYERFISAPAPHNTPRWIRIPDGADIQLYSGTWRVWVVAHGELDDGRPTSAEAIETYVVP